MSPRHPKFLSTAQIDALEQIVDENSVEALLAALATVCSEKAAHIEENYQDRGEARRWDAAARRIDTLAASPPIRAVTY